MALSNIVAWSTYHHTPSRFIKLTSPMHVVSVIKAVCLSSKRYKFVSRHSRVWLKVRQRRYLRHISKVLYLRFLKHFTPQYDWLPLLCFAACHRQTLSHFWPKSNLFNLGFIILTFLWERIQKRYICQVVFLWKYHLRQFLAKESIVRFLFLSSLRI